VPRLATSQLEQYLREICQDYRKHHKSFQQCLREIARNFATAKKKCEEIPATNCQDWHHNKSSTACVQLPRLANNKHFTTTLSYRNFYFIFVSLNFPGDLLSLRTPPRKEIL
jgi:CRISPR/Cas system CSM-associated protein Csm4 (group 5 of RAMP superfamily)